MIPTIEARGIAKRFGDTVALDGLDLTSEAGQVTAVLGPNGAGKTTFVRMVATLLRPDAGTLRVAGHDVATAPERVRELIGLAGQSAAVEPTLSGRENLEMVGRLYGQDRRGARQNAVRLLDELGLVEAGDRRVHTYSGGMRRRLDLGASLIGAPRLLLLDEPTTGLDPRSRMALWEAIRALLRRGTDVLLTTQYLDEADHLADRIVIIDEGRVAATGSPAELKRQVGGSVIDAQVRQRDHLPRLVEALSLIGSEPVQTHPDTNRVSLTVDRGPDRLAEALRAVGAAAIELDDISLRQPTLDEVFLVLTGRPPTDDAAAIGDTPAPGGSA